MERFLLDARYAVRMLRRSPAFTSVAVVVLALGIGVNTASFGLVDALLFKPLDVHAPDELVRVSTSGIDGAVSYPDYLDYQAGVRSLSGLAAFTADTLTLRTGSAGQSERVAAYLVSDNYFDVLGVPAARGRGLHASGGQPPGVVLSHDFWEKRLAADKDVVGRTVWLNETSFVVVGVAPPRFTGTLRGGAPHLFVPFTSTLPREDLSARGRRFLIAVGRLAPAASVEAAGAELRVVEHRLRSLHPQTNQGVAVSAGLESDAIFREVPQLTYVVIAVFTMFGLLLALACVNLAGLLTARATVRQREIAIRAMQGASRRAIAAQLLTESLVLAFMGGLGGLFTGVLARNLLWNRLQSGLADHLGFAVLRIDTSIDVRVSLFAIAISVGSVLLFGLMPALHASDPDLYSRAKEDHSSPPPAHLTRLRRLVGAQVMLSVVLLALAGLLVQTVRNAAAADLGYPLERAHVADLDLSGLDKGQAGAALERLLTGTRAMPGIEAAAVAAGGGPGYLPQSMTPDRPPQNYVLSFCGSRFFETLRVPILAGREFDDRDSRGSAPVAILNQRLAERLWPGQDAVGRQLVLWADQPALTVIGVSKTVRSFPIGPPFFQVYLPLAQHDVTSATLHVRTAHGQEVAIQRLLSEELRRSYSGLSVVRVRALADWVSSVLAIPRALVTAVGSLGAVALFLAAVGLYGVTAYVAGRRARECAIRRALGASRQSVLWLLVRSAMRTIVIGLGLGLALSLALGWLLKAALLGAAFDPVALVVAPTVLAATAMVAIAVPVLRAASLDIMVVLREE